MAVNYNIRGTTHGSFRIGKDGPTTYQGSSAPATSLGTPGDFFLRSGTLPRVYQKVGSDWVQLASSQRVVQAKSADYQTQIPDEIILVNTKVNPVTITLGNTTAKVGKSVVIKDAGGFAETNNITIQGQSGQLIDGLELHVIDQNRESITLVSDGNDWFLI